MALRIEEASPGFAARIEGFDVADYAEDDLAALREAMVTYAVVVLPNQQITGDQQVEFAARFGPLDSYPEASLSYNTGMRPDILSVSNERDGKTPLDRSDRRRLLDIGNKLWHSDSSFKKVPGHLSMLYGIQVTADGGETQFADLRAGYEAVPDDMKRAIEGLIALHSVMHSRIMLGFDDWDPELHRNFGAWAGHDIVRTLPESGRKTLYLSSHASHIAGMPLPVGRMLLHELTELATTQNNVYTHRWTRNDLVIWDNRCTMHRLRRYRASDELRVLRRVTTLDTEFPARDTAEVVAPDWVLDAVA
jgi:alpha-ketoglutarate-dependent 2,4-dichlorophenoxyacetate dioxygenase